MRLSRYLDDDNSSSDRAENVIIDMQFELANATNVANAGEEGQYHPLTVNDALDAYPLSFGQVAKGLGIVKNSSLIHDAKVIFSSLDAFDFIEDFISRQELEELKLYLAYVYVDASATRLSKEFYQAYFDLNGRALGGETTVSPRSSTCLTVETSNLPELIGKYYVQKMLDSTQDEDIYRMVRLIRAALRNHMNELTWLDGPTRKAAQGKLAKVDAMIGPKKDKSYSYTLDSRAFFENVKTIALDSWATSARKIGKRVDRSEWTMAATENNAYYSPSTNQIVFPAAGLQAPMYSTSFHPAQNFRAVGSTIGHELTHGFDSTGREYDGEGNRANWWSNRSSEQFDERAQCFSSQYSNFAVVSANGFVLGHVNGDQTITENIADNSGFNLAFGAYQAYMRNVSLTGMAKLSTPEGEQLFFIAYGQSWCGKMDDSMMQYILTSDPHSPAKWRVNGAVMNNPDFAGVFKCKAGAKMNPKHKCEMW